MAGSLFNRYQMEIPTEQFSFKVFKEAFAAIQVRPVELWRPVGRGVAGARHGLLSLLDSAPRSLNCASTAQSVVCQTQGPP